MNTLFDVHEPNFTGEDGKKYYKRTVIFRPEAGYPPDIFKNTGKVFTEDQLRADASIAPEEKLPENSEWWKSVSTRLRRVDGVSEGLEAVFLYERADAGTFPPELYPRAVL